MGLTTHLALTLANAAGFSRGGASPNLSLEPVPRPEAVVVTEGQRYPTEYRRVPLAIRANNHSNGSPSQ
jgi:hypothetical protein